VKKKLILNSFIMLLISTTYFGCKISQNLDAKDKEVTDVGGITSPGPRNYTTSELEIGRRICSNLKKKREFFETLTNEKEQFRFRGELSNCDRGVYSNSLFVASIANANGTEPEYLANRENYFKDITTDQSGVIKTQCDLMNQSDVVANNIISGNIKYSINFLIADGYDTYQIVKAKKNAVASYDALSSEAVSLISNINQASLKFLGVEKDRIRHTMCDGKRYKTVRQVWVEAITKF